MGKLLAFPYFGSKASLCDIIIGLLPEHTHYIEPFGGSGAVLLNKPSSKIETFNDLDNGLVTFFRVLRSNPDELLRQIQLTPYSRFEYELAKEPTEGLSDIEIARRFYVKIRQGFNATTRTYTGWRREKQASRGVPCSRSWQTAIPDFEALCKRLLTVQIENRSAFDVIRECDSASALFYLDPPYVLKTRKYKKAYTHELDNHQHKKLASLLNSLKGKVILSGYDCDLYREIYSSWTQIDIPVKINSSHAERIESLWMNFKPNAIAVPATQLKIEGLQ